MPAFRPTLTSLLQQAKKHAGLLALLYLAAIACLLTAGAVGVARGIPLSTFLREPQMVVHVPFYVGILSTLGCFMWAATAAICFFGFYIMRRWNAEFTATAFYLYWGVLTFHFALDDMFTFHESLYWVLFHFSENAVYLAYLVITAVGLILFRNYIVKTDYVLLLLALMFF